MRTLTFHRVIGAGATGTVYHADLQQGGAARPCAVKVMNAAAPDGEQFRARLRDEARLLGLLRDAQILGVSELVKVDGQDCVLMEYVEGVDLGELLGAQRMPAKALAELGADLAGTIHRAHTATHPVTGAPLHVIHRDVKPANVLLTRRGAVRLLDFGVARAAFDNRETNTQGLVLGTLNYFPPEILAGAEPTPAVDLYGLGITLWECGVGREWGTPQVHRQRFERRIDQRMAELDTDYDAVVAVIRRLLQWQPKDRPTAQEVEKLLLAAADGSGGMGLRAWARKAVPPALAKREREAVSDPLLGKTLPVEAMPEPPLALAKLQPLSEAIERPARAAETQTFNDLAPPAAVVRPGRGRRAKTPPPPPVDTGALPVLELDATGGIELPEEHAPTEPKSIPPSPSATARLNRPEGASTIRRSRSTPEPVEPRPELAETLTTEAAVMPLARVPPASPAEDPGAETLLISNPAVLQLAAPAAPADESRLGLGLAREHDRDARRRTPPSAACSARDAPVRHPPMSTALHQLRSLLDGRHPGHRHREPERGERLVVALLRRGVEEQRGVAVGEQPAAALDLAVELPRAPARVAEAQDHRLAGVEQAHQRLLRPGDGDARGQRPTLLVGHAALGDDRARAALHGAAPGDRDLGVGLEVEAAVDVEHVLQLVLELPVHDDAHGALFVVVPDQDDGPLEERILRLGRGDQQGGGHGSTIQWGPLSSPHRTPAPSGTAARRCRRRPPR
ncbi:MAG: protein kinase [Myxococcota bacterium]